MIFDFLVLVLATYSLLRHTGGARLGDFGTVLFRDGIVYFVVAFVSYLACTILNNLGIRYVCCSISSRICAYTYFASLAPL